jgi:hypothetical protein
MRFENIIEELKLHFGRVDSITPVIKSWIPLTEKDFDNVEKVTTIDSFIYRFNKIQDRMGDRLFPKFLQLMEEYSSRMPLIDVLNELERLEIIGNAAEWIEYRKLRNSLTHDYPGNIEEIIEALEQALEAYEKMKMIYSNIVEQVQKRGLSN